MEADCSSRARGKAAFRRHPAGRRRALASRAIGGLDFRHILDVSGSAVSAQSQRLNVVASNLANADTVAGPDGSPYKARQVVFQTLLMGAPGTRSRDAPQRGRATAGR